MARSHMRRGSAPGSLVSTLALGLTLSSAALALDAPTSNPDLGVVDPATPPPATAPGPDAPPAVTPPAAAPPPAPPAPVSPATDVPAGDTEVRPLTAIGNARWADNVGFLQPGAPPTDSGTTSNVATAPRVGSLDLDLSMTSIGVGRSRLNATNDGVTADETAFYVTHLTLDQRLEWRNRGALFGPWLDFGVGLMHGSRTLEQMGVDTEISMSMTVVQLHGRFGLDVIPIEYVGVGPFAGLFLDSYAAKVAGEEFADDAYFNDDIGVDLGPVFGLHARLRTKARPDEPSRFYVDPALTLKRGRFNTAPYASVETGVRAGSSLYLVGSYQQRLSASGHFSVSAEDTEADVTGVSAAYAASMPVDRRFGLSVAFAY